MSQSAQSTSSLRYFLTQIRFYCDLFKYNLRHT